MKLIILDRDGVINQDSDQFIKSPDEWKPIPGSLEAIARLNQWGWRVVVASNQSGIGRGLFGMDTLNAINEKMVKSLAQVGGRLDAIFFCPHTPEENCPCRKPKPGMLLDALRRFGANAAETPMAGDGLRDLRAAKAAGCPRHLLRSGNGAKTQADGIPHDVLPIAVHDDLAAMVDALLGERTP